MSLKEGQRLKVTAGPFADLVGQLEWLDDKGRVRLLLELMGEPCGLRYRGPWWRQADTLGTMAGKMTVDLPPILSLTSIHQSSSALGTRART
jgi:hypothetical protein